MPLTPRAIHRMARGLPAETTVQELVDHVDLGWIVVHLGRIEPGKRAEWLGPPPAGPEPAGVFGDDLVVRVDRPVREDRRARLRRGATESFGGAPLVPVTAPCPGTIRWKGPSARVEGEFFDAEVEVENRSSAEWAGWSIDPRREVAVHGQFVGAAGKVLRAWKEALPADLGPGERLRFPVSFGQAPSAGRWTLRHGLVQGVAGDLAECAVEGEEDGGGGAGAFRSGLPGRDRPASTPPRRDRCRSRPAGCSGAPKCILTGRPSGFSVEGAIPRALP